MATNKLDEAVKRRVRAGRLLLAGKSPSEVARLVGAPRQTVYRWREVLNVGGIEALRDMNKGGRPAQLGAAELSRLYVMLLEGPTGHGFATPLWTLKRVRLLIEREFGVGTARCTSGVCSDSSACPTRSPIGALWSATLRRSSTGAN